MASQSGISDELSEPSTMEDVLKISGRQSTSPGIMTCCKLSYRMRKLTNRGALIVLMRNMLVSTLFFYFTIHNKAHYHKSFYITWGITVPVIGWLADVRLGRHKVIQWSMWIMWAGFMLATVSSVLVKLVESYTVVHRRLVLALLIIAAGGFGGHQANTIQFGIDQLHDASTDEITSFISWYMWTTISGGVAVNYAFYCTSDKDQLIAKLVVCVCLSAALAMSLLLDGKLIKEPLTQNPFKLVFKVLQYAIKNKRPRQRSAFTYCEDELPSRIDFGKSKYGGPFTTEQVEDVKTLLRLLSVVILGSAMPSCVLTMNDLTNKVNKLIYERISDTPTPTCYLDMFYGTTTFFSASIAIPVYEFLIYPVLRRYFHWVKSYFKFGLGVLLQIGRAIAFMVIVTVARDNYLEESGHNATIQCIFLEHSTGGDLSTVLNSKWLIIPNILDSLSIATLGIGGIEFICAQTPYSMRGLVFGVAYGSVAAFSLIGYGISQAFMTPSSYWGNGKFSCGFWYLLLVLLLLVINGTVLTVLGRWYKMRKREDVLPNEQIFAERYYAQ